VESNQTWQYNYDSNRLTVKTQTSAVFCQEFFEKSEVFRAHQSFYPHLHLKDRKLLGFSTPCFHSTAITIFIDTYK
jgi:hypothetical protein